MILTNRSKMRFARDIRPKAAPLRPRHENGVMNKTEAAYALVLNNKLLAGEIAGWWFELITIKLADRCSLQPDFLVMLNDGSLEFHEVKGGKNGTGNQWIYWAEEDAKVKLKVAATIQPLPLFVVYPQRGGVKNGWCVERVGRE